MRLRIFLCLLAATMASALPDAQQWPRFRGFDDGNIADDPNLPDTWSETENIRWKTDIPGPAGAPDHLGRARVPDRHDRRWRGAAAHQRLV